MCPCAMWPGRTPGRERSAATRIARGGGKSGGRRCATSSHGVREDRRRRGATWRNTWPDSQSDTMHASRGSVSLGSMARPLRPPTLSPHPRFAVRRRKPDAPAPRAHRRRHARAATAHMVFTAGVRTPTCARSTCACHATLNGMGLSASSRASRSPRSSSRSSRRSAEIGRSACVPDSNASRMPLMRSSTRRNF